jgi:hypothetical protein
MTMTDLQEILADALPTTVFVYASAACLALCAVAALWLQARGERTGMSIRHAAVAAAAVLLLAVPSAGWAGPLEATIPLECALREASVVTSAATDIEQHGAAGAFETGDACAQGRVVTRW